MIISASNCVKNGSKNYSKNIKQATSNISFENNFQFSKVYSNALKNNILANISFSSSKITLSKLREKERMVNKDSVNAYFQLQNVYYQLAPCCMEESRALQSEIARDIENLGKDKNLKAEKTIMDKEVVLKRLTRFDSFDKPVYSAEFCDGKIDTINVFDMDGAISAVLKFDSKTSLLTSYQKGFDGVSGNYDYKITFKQDSKGQIVPDKYFEKCVNDDLGFSNFDKIMTFDNEEKMLYQEGVDRFNPINSRAQRISRQFDFENYQTFAYTAGFNRGGVKNLYTSGEMIEIEDFNLRVWDKGYSIKEGSETQEPAIVIDGNNVIEYDEGYEINNCGDLTRHNYLKMEQGIPMNVLQALGFYR